MKKTKTNNNGITLVALVVTIVVLLILAGVSIVTLFGESGIITAAQKAADATRNSVTNDLKDLKELEDYILDSTSGKEWIEVKNEKGQVVEVKRGSKTLQIGDYISYDCTSGEGKNATYTSYSYDNRAKNNGITSGYSEDQTFNAKDYTGGWRVLGVNDDGELLIMATDGVPKIDKYKSFYLGINSGIENAKQGKAAYQYAVEELNNISSIYGKGIGANSGRVITVNDINKITGYDPENIGRTTGLKYGKDKISEYGNKVTFTWDNDGNVLYTSTNEVSGTLSTNHSENGFTWLDKSSNEWITSLYTLTPQANPIATLESTAYYYYPETLTEKKDINGTTGILHNSEIYNMLFKNTDRNKYWLGSKVTYISNSSNGYTLQCVSSGYVRYNGILLSSTGEPKMSYVHEVRPVVTLSSDIKLEPDTPVGEVAAWKIVEK